MEESVCEKMRSKYGGEWTQQPSSRLNSVLRTDARRYRAAVEEASGSDAQLFGSFRQFEGDFDEMRSAGETDEADVLYQRAMIKAGAGKKVLSPGVGGAEEGNLLDDDFGDEGRGSVSEMIERVEELMRKLQLVKRERQQVLKDLKDKVCLFPSHELVRIWTAVADSVVRARSTTTTSPPSSSSTRRPSRTKKRSSSSPSSRSSARIRIGYCRRTTSSPRL